MAKSDLVIRIAGESGEGIVTAGDILTLAAARAGYFVYTFRTYPAEVRGGHCMFQLRIGNEPVSSMGDAVDVLVALNQEGYDKHVGELTEHGALVYDPDTVRGISGDLYAYGVPLTRISKKDIGFAQAKNLVALGAVSQLFNVPFDRLEGVVRDRLGKRADVLEKNIASLNAGFQAAGESAKTDPYRLPETTDGRGRLVMNGNQAVVAGALVAGCGYYAGYPITPATDIMEGLAKELPGIGGRFLQCEDEIASIASVLGASYAGAKAMTATSGPGLSLMGEALGLAAMAEIPCVVVDTQRAGPSTGLPTKTEQSDLNVALYGSHGDSPRVVVAATDVRDCFYQTIEAFNLAEAYQTPVMLLSDQSLAARTETIEQPDFSDIRIIDRQQPDYESENGSYRRYLLNESGISPMAVPGQAGGRYAATGLEHTERGNPDYEPEMHEAMSRKRHRKLEILENELPAPPRYGAEHPTIGIISWGSTEGAIREAIDRAAANGIKVASLHPRVLHPLPRQYFADFISSVKTVLVPEVNYSGQFATYLAGLFAFQPVRVNKYGGLPFTAGDIYSAIEEANRG